MPIRSIAAANEIFTRWLPFCVGAFISLLASLPLQAEEKGNPRPVHDLTLPNYLQKVLAFNEGIQAQLLEVEISRRKYMAERGIFEPDFFASAERDSNSREVTSEQQRSLGSYYEERNNIYNGGLESLVPTGARVRLGYTLRDLNNSLQSTPYIGTGFTNGEYQTFLGISLNQPLLKNAWKKATMAAIRAAAASSEIAFQEYRRQMMLILSTAEAVYWNLYFSQEQLGFFRDSVQLAETILRDNKARLQAGKGSELEVMEAEAGLALRLSKQAEGMQKYSDALNRFITLYSEKVTTNYTVRAVDQPAASQPPPSYSDSWQMAFNFNPDYLSQRSKLSLENIRLAFSQNQRLPQLDLKASYGLNGLAESPYASWQDIVDHDYQSWSIGLELRIPLTGGIKSRNELAAAKLRVRQALLNLKEMETQIVNGLSSSVSKARSARQNVDSYRTVVEYNQTLLQNQLARLEVGKVESRKVLEVDADLFEARNALVDAKVQYQRALLEVELLRGSLLKSLGLDLTKPELEKRTASLARKGGVNDLQYQWFILELQQNFRQSPRGAEMAPSTNSPAAWPTSTGQTNLFRSTAPLREAKP